MSVHGTPRFLLPGEWDRIDLSSEKAAKESIARCAEARIGVADDRAVVRGEIRKKLEGIAHDARQGGASEFHIASEIATGVPLAATLSVFPIDESSPQMRALSAKDAATLLRGMETSAARESLDTATVSSERVSAVRHLFRRTIRREDEGGEYELLEVSYWLAAGYPARFAMMHFSTLVVQLQDQFVELCDAIVGTAQWPLKPQDKAVATPQA